MSTKSSISGGQTIFFTYGVSQVKYQWGSNHFLYLWCQPSQVSVGVKPFSLPMVSAKSSISGGQTIFSTYGVNQVKHQSGSNHFLYLWCQPSQVSVGVEPFSLPMVSTKSSISGGRTIFSTYDVNQVKYQWGSNHFLYLWCQPSQVSVVVEPFSLPMVSAKSSINGGRTIFSTYGVSQVKYQWESNHFLYLWCQPSQVSVGVESFSLPVMSTKLSVTGVKPFTLPMVSTKSSISGGRIIFTTCDVNQVKYHRRKTISLFVMLMPTPMLMPGVVQQLFLNFVQVS